MYKFLKINYKTVVILLIIFGLVTSISGQEIINKTITYSSQGNLQKKASSEFSTNAIEIPIENPEPFVAIGFTANIDEQNNHSHFYIRVSTDGNNWSNWELVENDDDAQKVENKFMSSLSFIDKEKRFIQLKTNVASNLSDLKIVFISPGKTDKNKIKNSLQKNELSKSTLGIDRPTYVNRKAWGCPQNENESSRSLTTVTHLIIHHSAGNTVSNDYAAVVRSYWDYHVNGHGWADIGYNWLVDPNGVLYKGRAWKSSTHENVMGAHNSGKNSGTAGICFIGNYVSTTPSDNGLNMIANISAFLCKKYNIDPEGKSYHSAIGKTNDNITGHGQSGGGTSCPGTQIKNRMQSIRELTSSKIIDVDAAPQVASTYPNSKIDSAYHSKMISIEFTHPMNQSSVESGFSIAPNIFGTMSWNSDGNTFYFTPSPSLTGKTNYTITISKTAMSLWNVPLTDDVELSFVTKARDNLSLVANYPENGDSNIPTNISIGLKFDGALKSSSLGGNIHFRDEANNDVAISVNTSEYYKGIIRFTPRNSLNENSSYSIELKEGISSTDNYSFGMDTTITFTTKSTTSVNESELPEDYNLLTAYPNPFNPTTTLQYQLKKSSHVSIKIYDVIGNLVTTLLDREITAGKHKISFKANNLPSGIYFSQIITNSESKTIKLLLAK